MRIFIGSFLILVSGPVAAGTISWRYDGDLFESARTPAQYRMLARIHPDYFNEDESSVVDSASVTTALWTLVGETHCAETDPRAHVKTVAFMLCEREVGKEAVRCSGGTNPPTPILPKGDPCAND